MLDLSGYHLTLDDEFNTLSISQNGTGTVWSDIRPGSRMGPNADIGFGNSAFVDPASGINPFSLQNGALVITAVRADSTIAGPAQWASGLISTMGSFSQQYGYFEMRAELPTETGVWPAFWLLSADGTWPPEIDALEAYGDANLYQYTHTIQTGQHTYEQTWSAQPTMTTGYHTYGVMWNPQTVTFYFDGQVTGQQTTPSDMQGRMYMVADLAMQMKSGVSDDPKQLSIDYIRAYWSDPAVPAVALGSVSSPDGADTSSMYGATSLGSAPSGGASIINGNGGIVEAAAESRLLQPLNPAVEMTQDVELLPDFPQARIGQTQLSWRGCAHGLTCSHYADKPDATFVSLRMLIWPVTSHRYS